MNDEVFNPEQALMNWLTDKGDFPFYQDKITIPMPNIEEEPWGGEDNLDDGPIEGPNA